MTHSATSILPANVRCVLFDAVGTLIYAEPTVAEAYRAVGLRFGLDLSVIGVGLRFASALARERGLYTGRLERPPTTDDHERAHWQRIVTAVLKELPDAGGQPFELLWQHFANPASWRLYDDAAPTLAGLKNLGLVLGIASNFDSRLHTVVRGLGPLSACSRTFVSSEIGFSKPDPRFFAAVASQLGLRPDQILLVGDDHTNDYDGALAAGWRGVLIYRDVALAGSHISALTELLS